MSAREAAVDMVRRICPPHLDADLYADAMADLFTIHAYELAEQQRALRDREYWPELLKAEKNAVNRVIDLIDPEVN